MARRRWKKKETEGGREKVHVVLRHSTLFFFLVLVVSSSNMKYKRVKYLLHLKPQLNKEPIFLSNVETPIQ